MIASTRLGAKIGGISVALALAIAAGEAPAQAPLQPIDLRVDGGEDGWHAGRQFALRWVNPAGAIAAAHYRLLDPQGQEIGRAHV